MSETPEVNQQVTDTSMPEVVIKTDEGTLLGNAAGEVKVDATADAKAAELVKAEALKNETLEQKATREASEKAATDAKAVPEKYEVKAPEGMEIDSVLLEKITPVFKELGITKEGAQKLVDAYAPHVKAMVETQQKAAIDNWKKYVDGMKTETKTMLGADAAKELSFAAKFIDRMSDSPEEAKKLREFFEETGVGNHKLLTKLLIKAGKRISSDSFVEGTKSGAGEGASLYNHPTSVATLIK